MSLTPWLILNRVISQRMVLESFMINSYFCGGFTSKLTVNIVAGIFNLKIGQVKGESIGQWSVT